MQDIIFETVSCQGNTILNIYMFGKRNKKWVPPLTVVCRVEWSSANKENLNMSQT